VSFTVNDIPVDTQPVPIAASKRGTSVGGADLPVAMGFSVKNLMNYPAGKYVGVVAFRVMAIP